MTDNDFLRNLKVGDEVAIDNGRYGSESWLLGNVTKITPTGRIVVVDNGGREWRFDNQGLEIGSGGRYSKSDLKPVTQRVLAWFDRRQALYEINQIDFKKIDTEVLWQIVAIVKGDNQ